MDKQLTEINQISMKAKYMNHCPAPTENVLLNNKCFEFTT